MEWIRKKVINWLIVDIKSDIEKEVTRQIKEIIEDITGGDYRHYYHDNSKLVQDFNDTIRNIVKDYARVDVLKIVTEIVYKLEINQESFLDDVVKRLKAKQVK